MRSWRIRRSTGTRARFSAPATDEFSSAVDISVPPAMHRGSSQPLTGSEGGAVGSRISFPFVTFAPASHICGILDAQGFQQLGDQMSDKTTPDVESGYGAASHRTAFKPERARRRTLPAVAVVVLAAVAMGVAAAYAWLTLRDDPTPPAPFALAVGTALATLATLAATLPATLAARRDPVRELRVP